MLEAIRSRPLRRYLSRSSAASLRLNIRRYEVGSQQSDTTRTYQERPPLGSRSDITTIT